MAPYSHGKQIADCESPHDWLMNLAIDLATLCDMCRWNGTDGSYLAVFSEDVDFTHHFVATHLPPNLPPYRSVSDIGTPVKSI